MKLSVECFGLVCGGVLVGVLFVIVVLCVFSFVCIVFVVFLQQLKKHNFSYNTNWWLGHQHLQDDFDKYIVIIEKLDLDWWA